MTDEIKSIHKIIEDAHAEYYKTQPPVTPFQKICIGMNVDWTGGIEIGNGER